MAKRLVRCLGIRLRPTIEHAIIIILLTVVVLLLYSDDKRGQTRFSGTTSNRQKSDVSEKLIVIDSSTPNESPKLQDNGAISGARGGSENAVNDGDTGQANGGEVDDNNGVAEDVEDENNDNGNKEGTNNEEDSPNAPPINNEVEVLSMLNFSMANQRTNISDPEVQRLADERERHLAVECERLGLNKKGWPRLPANLLVNDKFKAIYCMVGKVASSTWKKVFLMATGHLDPSHINETRYVKLGPRANKAFTPLNAARGRNKLERLETYFRFMFVRHPMDRLTSTYLEKFRLMPQSIRPVARRIVREYRPNATAASLESGNDVTFEEFVRFIVDHGRTKPDIHWTPQSKLCLPCSMRYNFIGRYETMWGDADHVLRRLGVPDNKANFPRWSKPREAGMRYEEMIAKIDQRYVDGLKKFYQQDYELFGYT